MEQKMVTIWLDEDFLNEIDTYRKNFGFHSRSDFIRFACSNTMNKFDSKESVVVQKSYFDYLRQSIKDRLADDITKSIGIDAEGIKKELYDVVFKGVLKKIVEHEEIQK